MINPLAVATRGYLHGVSTIATRGYLFVVIQVDEDGTFRSSKVASLDQINNDDGEILQIIMMATKSGLF